MGVPGAMKRIMGSNPRKLFLRNLSGYPDRDNLKVVIDGQSMTCRYSIGSLNSKKYVLDRKGKKIPEIYYLFIIAVRFIKAGITPVFVFDGRAPSLKAETVEKRGQSKDKAEEMAEEMMEDHLEDDSKQQNDEELEEYIKCLKRSYRPDMDNIENAKLLLGYMGVPVVDAPGEADAQCAAIAHHYSSTVLGVITDDFDALMCGAPGVLKMPSLGSNTIDHYTLADTLENLTMSMRRVIRKSSDPVIKKLYAEREVTLDLSHMVEIGCMMGNDYGPGLRFKHSGDKFEAILELYAKNELSLDNVLSSLSGSLSQDYIKRMQDSRDLYTKVEVLNPESLNLSMTEPSVEMVTKMCSEFISENDIMNTVTMLVNTYRSKNRKFDRNYRVPLDNEPASTDHYGDRYGDRYGSKRYGPWDSTGADSFGSFASYKQRYAKEQAKHLTSGTTRGFGGSPPKTYGSGATKSYNSGGAQAKTVGFGTKTSFRIEDSCHAEASKSWPEALYRRQITLTG